MCACVRNCCSGRDTADCIKCLACQSDFPTTDLDRCRICLIASAVGSGCALGTHARPVIKLRNRLQQQQMHTPEAALCLQYKYDARHADAVALATPALLRSMFSQHSSVILFTSATTEPTVGRIFGFSCCSMKPGV